MRLNEKKKGAQIKNGEKKKKYERTMVTRSNLYRAKHCQL